MAQFHGAIGYTTQQVSPQAPPGNRIGAFFVT